VDAHIQTVSLLPHLCGNGGKICLDVSTIKIGLDPSGGRVGTFTPDYTGDFLAVGFKVWIRTDFGSPVKQVMLLTQRDHYPFLSKQFSKVTNSIVDKCWLQAAGRNEEDGFRPGQLLFSEQFTEKGGFLPFSPLFFCNKRELFFHPPCLRCGRMLRLCRDDELLGEFGLPQYSKSLRRYMYCPSCTPLHGAPWYVRTRDGEENSVVKDSEQLLQDFGLIQSEVAPDTSFPCSECLYHDDCYGTAAVLDVIKSLSFYPFFMVLTESITCSGHEYLAMVSGASSGQLDDYRQERGVFRSSISDGELLKNYGADRFLYPVEDSRHFLEILYLKMQFLRLVVQDLLNNNLANRFSGHYIPTDIIGVSLIPNLSFPSFWSFSLSYPGLGESFSEVAPCPKESDLDHTYMIGLLWFVVLLSNRQQGEAEIFKQLAALLEKREDKTLPLSSIGPMFQPCQVFWSSRDEYDNAERWIEQWDKILAIGRDLFVAGYYDDVNGKLDILDIINTCLAELKGYILSSAQIETDHIQNSDDIEIYNIIEKVKEKWGQKVDADNTQDKTVIIPPSTGISQMTVAETDHVDVVAAGNAFDETVIILSEGKHPRQACCDPFEKTSDPLQSMVSPVGDEDLEETVQIRPNQGTGPIDTEEQLDFPENSVKRDHLPQDDDDFLTETVVLRPIKKED